MEARPLGGTQRRRAVASAEREVGHDSWRKALLACGIVSSLLFGAMIAAIRFDGYSRVTQVLSELTAIGAPTRSLWMWLGSFYTVLIAAFGWGVWKSAGGKHAVRIAGWLILGYGSLGLLWPFAPMHQRELLAAGGATFSDTLHVILAGVTVLLMFFAIGFGAAAFGNRFRLYSIISVVVLLAFGALTFLEAPRLQANLPTPWIGLWERINISVFLLWVVVLATVLLRASKRPAAADRRSPITAITVRRRVAAECGFSGDIPGADECVVRGRGRAGSATRARVSLFRKPRLPIEDDIERRGRAERSREEKTTAIVRHSPLGNDARHAEEPSHRSG